MAKIIPSWDGAEIAEPVVRQTLWALLLFVVLPNLVFWLLEYWFELERPLVNLDYLFAGICFAVGWGCLGIGVLSVLFFVDVLVLVGQVYPFLRLPDLAYLVGLLPSASIHLQIIVVLLFCYLAALCFFLKLRSSCTGLLAALIPFNVVLLLYGVHVYGGGGGRERMWHPQKNLLVNSQSINFLENRIGGFVQSFSVAGEAFSKAEFPGRTMGWRDVPTDSLNDKLLLIVAESWGQFVDEGIQRAIIAPIVSEHEHFDLIEIGEIPFRGATVAAELRELCGLSPNHFNLKEVEAGFEGCLPNKLQSAGYQTAAVHGAVGLMYDRIFWYPRVGFDEVHFRETDDWDSRCFSFPGVCDAEIAQKYIGPAFSGAGKKFVYWLTLNSHSFYDRRDLHGSYLDCKEHALPDDSELCRMAELHAQFFADLALLLKSPSMQGVEVLVVGDHMPPLMSTKDKSAYIKLDTVSWLHLRVGTQNDSSVKVASGAGSGGGGEF